jgi:hypothetical protein
VSPAYLDDDDDLLFVLAETKKRSRAPYIP